MDGVFETQPDRTDLPLVVMPVVIESMIGPFKQNFTMLDNVARVRMYEDFTLDEDTIVERCKDADAVMVIGFHCADAILDRLDAMVEQAFDDQCTGANPGYPLMSEIKQMYLNAYYGTDVTK